MLHHTEPTRCGDQRPEDFRLGSGVSGSVTWGSGNIGENTTAHDPNFDSSFKLQCPSLSINGGLNADVPADTENVDEDGSTTEKTPDRALATRIVAGTVDMGAFETQGLNCPGDTDGNGTIDVLDLLAVISQWGITCPCTADVDTSCGDGAVNVLDLLAVMNAWGECGTPGNFPESISDCWSEYCNGLSGEDYTKCLDRCVEAYCSQTPTPEDCP